MTGKLFLKDDSEWEGVSFGAENNLSGEVVFTTGMVGYPETLTDPSYRGQILVFTFPLIGNYGVAEKKFWESKRIQVAGIIVCNYNDTPSHYKSRQTLSEWLKAEKIPALEIKDTRALTLKLRTQGVMLGGIEAENVAAGTARHEWRPVASATVGDAFEDPNLRNLVAEVSTKNIYEVQEGNPTSPKLRRARKTIALIDCGAKLNIARRLAARGLKVIVVPWDFNPLKLRNKLSGVVISNGPGDPQMAQATIENVRKVMAKKIPIFGICLGNQILALAAGGTTYKLKFGHRGQNQPCVLKGTNTCVLTTQNHGFAVGKIPKGFKEWFYNANDKTNEGIIHTKLPFMSVQFHPEATPGPTDADWIFDEFIRRT